jgi:hypothetical protein
MTCFEKVAVTFLRKKCFSTDDLPAGKHSGLLNRRPIPRFIGSVHLSPAGPIFVSVDAMFLFPKLLCYFFQQRAYRTKIHSLFRPNVTHLLNAFADPRHDYLKSLGNFLWGRIRDSLVCEARSARGDFGSKS